MLKTILLTTSLVVSSYALTAAEFKVQQEQGFQQQTQEFKQYKTSQEAEFKAYQKAQEEAFKAYKKEIGVFWEKPKLSSQKNWVAYTKDKKTRSDVDFEKEEIVIETIATSPQEAEANLKTALAKTVTIDTKTVQLNDPLEQKLAKIKKPKGVVDAKVQAEPILSTVVFQKPPTQKSVKSYVNQHVQPSQVQATQSSKVPHAKIYSVKVKMPKNSMVKRSKIYYDEVKANARKHNLPISLVFAIMHSESSFNPRARSHIPAYGLMQIVPKTAGIDTYKFLYGKKRLVSGSYLYNSTNNIKMGTAYLHILYYRYLKKIKDPDSRMYCAIAAYNTGAGNIAYAFTRKYNMNKAAPLINAMTPDEVYNKLLRDLRFDEPKHYLKKVSKRMAAYHKIYGS